MHLKMYCTKMGIWSQDENFLMSFFSETLTGAAWEWCMQLDRFQIKCWEDLVLAFTNQYEFNLNVAPTRDQRKSMKKKDGEMFKKMVVWHLLDDKVIEIQEEVGPNIKHNPLPKYNEGKGGKKMLNDDINYEFPYMCQEYEEKHNIDASPTFKAFVQKLFKLGVLEVPHKLGRVMENINMITSKSLVFKVPPQNPTLVFRTHNLFHYQSNDVVPWVYETVMEDPSRLKMDLEKDEITTNIVGMEGMIKSGRSYMPSDNLKVAKENPIEKPKE
ncbi:hypothetical protein SESBI_38109 [Sesbania bispinosa]|nr:hypothetical protein SESBI_38109 [Sesbania bispinosa]